MALKKGDNVKQIVPVITGTIDSKRFDEDTDSFEYLVTYKDAQGNDVSRWFNDQEIQAV